MNAKSRAEGTNYRHSREMKRADGRLREENDRIIGKLDIPVLRRFPRVGFSGYPPDFWRLTRVWCLPRGLGASVHSPLSIPPYISLADRQRVRACVTGIHGPRGTANSVDNRFPSLAHRIISAFRQHLVYADCAG